MSLNYQSQLGVSDITTDGLTVDGDLIVKGSLTLPDNASAHKVLTCIDSTGITSWQSPSIVVLNGDTVGPASTNRVDTLAGGTIAVNNLVQKNGIVNNISPANGKVLTCNDSNGNSSWQTPSIPVVNLFSGVFDPTRTYSIGNRVSYNKTNPPPATESFYGSTFTGYSIENLGSGNYWQFGLVLRFNTSGYVRGIRFYQMAGYATPPLGCSVGLWSQNSNFTPDWNQTIAQANIVDGWNDVILDTPMPVNAGSLWSVSYTGYQNVPHINPPVFPPATAHMTTITSGLINLGYKTIDGQANPYDMQFNDVYGVDLLFALSNEFIYKTPTAIYTSLQNSNINNIPLNTIGTYWKQEITGFDDNGNEYETLLSNVGTLTNNLTSLSNSVATLTNTIAPQSTVLNGNWPMWDSNQLGPFTAPLSIKIKIVKSFEGMVCMQFPRCLANTDPNASSLIYAQYSVSLPSWAIPMDPDGNSMNVSSVVAIIYGPGNASRGFAQITITSDGYIQWRMIDPANWTGSAGYNSFSISYLA